MPKKIIIILDVRDKEEFEKEHIKGAINISRGLLEFLVENKIPDKKARIVVY
ncbi:MAG TPA: rhodanese-like domain-containing protein [Nitrospirae bacterium]|nr:rhodanese-like domain-containing protein [Nitrospirota bacterium]